MLHLTLSSLLGEPDNPKQLYLSTQAFGAALPIRIDGEWVLNTLHHLSDHTKELLRLSLTAYAYGTPENGVQFIKHSAPSAVEVQSLQQEQKCSSYYRVDNTGDTVRIEIKLGNDKSSPSLLVLDKRDGTCKDRVPVPQKQATQLSHLQNQLLGSIAAADSEKSSADAQNSAPHPSDEDVSMTDYTHPDDSDADADGEFEEVFYSNH